MAKPALTYSQALLIFLSLCGFWTLWVFPYQNGLLAILGKQSEPGAVIPGPTPAPMKQTYTGVKVVDKQLTTLVSFFYTAIDGNRADVSLAFLYLGGQVLAAWILITIEGLRAGNQTKFWLTTTTLLGVGVAIIGYACIIPLWFALHLSLSPTAVNPRDFQLVVNTPAKLALAPVSILLGFGIPSLLMCFPAPAWLSFEAKQTWTGIQQGWSIWIGITQYILTSVVLNRHPRATTLTESAKRTETIKYLRGAYILAILVSAGSHLFPWILSLLAYAFPVLFSSTYLLQLQPSRIFVPVLPFGSHEVKVLADGALWFLQWDTLVGVTATLVWALALEVAARPQPLSPKRNLTGSLGVALVTLAIGPCGAAAALLWARDEIVFRASTSEDGTVTKKRE
ncbi:hypothetical protein ABEF95_006494 [Exophiala dermatitidis]